LCVDWVAAKVQLHSAQSRPQLHRTAVISIQHKCQVLLQTLAQQGHNFPQRSRS